ncbi:MAG TPA: hypothetical protein VH088_01170 [Terriglobales bacterium]|jgi:hypothetical protein|nr:hypothetical protein [Terriglobales bacterium]
MRRPPKICAILIAFVASLGAHTQSSDWKYLEDLPQGARISVASFQSLAPVECVFRHANEQTLRCDPVHRRHGRQFEFNRRSVWQVRLQRRENHNHHWGAIIGGSIGSIVGVAAPSENASAKDRVLTGMVLGGIGAVIGATADHDLPHVSVGPVIYEKPRE